MAGSGCTNGPRGRRGFRSGGPGVHHVRKETLGGASEGQSRVPSESRSHCPCQLQENEAQCVSVSSVSVANLRAIEVIPGGKSWGARPAKGSNYIPSDSVHGTAVSEDSSALELEFSATFQRKRKRKGPAVQKETWICRGMCDFLNGLDMFGSSHDWFAFQLLRKAVAEKAGRHGSLGCAGYQAQRRFGTKAVCQDVSCGVARLFGWGPGRIPRISSTPSEIAGKANGNVRDALEILERRDSEDSLARSRVSCRNCFTHPCDEKRRRTRLNHWIPSIQFYEDPMRLAYPTSRAYEFHGVDGPRPHQYQCLNNLTTDLVSMAQPIHPILSPSGKEHHRALLQLFFSSWCCIYSFFHRFFFPPCFPLFNKTIVFFVFPSILPPILHPDGKKQPKQSMDWFCGNILTGFSPMTFMGK